MKETVISVSELLRRLPMRFIPAPERAEVRDLRSFHNTVIIAIDDDPTGTQTVHDVPVLTTYKAEDIEAEIRAGAEVIFILSNSRSLMEAAACTLAEQIGQEIAKVQKRTGKKIIVISRSDSTLRGHYPAEVKALERGLCWTESPVLLIPAFFEGGRITYEDVHYVREGDNWIPAGQTPFAKDKVFGYQHSNLHRWVQEKHGTNQKLSIESLSLGDLRQSDDYVLKSRINRLADGSICVINAEEYEDLLRLVGIIISLHRNYIFRTAASAVAAFAAQDEKPELESADLDLDPVKGGLIVVGSYVPKTSMQLEKLQAGISLISMEIDVPALLRGDFSEPQVLAEEIDLHVSRGETVLLYTSRELISGESDEENLGIGEIISTYIHKTVKSITEKPRYMLTKGGITYSVVATDSLQIKRATVLGQIAAGVPVWRAGRQSVFPDLLQIVFPGNVGSDSALLEVVRKLEQRL